MNLGLEILLSEYLWWIVAIILTFVTGWFTLQSVVLGLPLNRFLQFMWILSISAWLMIFARSFINFIINDTSSQVIVAAIIILYLLFTAPTKKTKK